MLLNNDVKCRADFLERLVAPLRDGAVGSVASLMLQPGEERIDSVGLTADVTLASFPRLHGLPAACADDPCPVLAGPAGTAAAYRRAAWEQVGGLDETIFTYMEDFDLALRLRSAGWESVRRPRRGGGASRLGHARAPLGVAATQRGLRTGVSATALWASARSSHRPRAGHRGGSGARRSAHLSRPRRVAGSHAWLERRPKPSPPSPPAGGGNRPANRIPRLPRTAAWCVRAACGLSLSDRCSRDGRRPGASQEPSAQEAAPFVRHPQACGQDAGSACRPHARAESTRRRAASPRS